MRTLYFRNKPLRFGKHSLWSIERVAKEDPGYFCWLWRNQVLSWHHPRDQRWYDRKFRQLMTNIEEGTIETDIQEGMGYEDH